MSDLSVLLGESSSGKDTIYKKLIESGFFKPCVSHTTRTIRENEEDGVEYYFISDDTFNEMEVANKFIETRIYEVKNSKGEIEIWHYGLSKEEYEKGNLVIVDIKGLNDLEKYLGKDNIVSIFIDARSSTRLLRSINRQRNQIDDELAMKGTSKSLTEIYRRLEADRRDFNGVEEIVDYILQNENEEDLYANVEFIIKLLIEREEN